MHIHKNYFHDKTVLALLIINIAMLLVAVLGVLLRVDPAGSETFTVQYRSNMGSLAFKSGPIGEIRAFALYSVLVTVVSGVLSVKLYGHRRHIATALLAATPFLLLFGLVVSDRLIAHS